MNWTIERQLALFQMKGFQTGAEKVYISNNMQAFH
jgi:hypothetical protein